jgi:thioredoxin 1
MMLSSSVTRSVRSSSGVVRRAPVSVIKTRVASVNDEAAVRELEKFTENMRTKLPNFSSNETISPAVPVQLKEHEKTESTHVTKPKLADMPGLKELNTDNFDSFLAEAGDNLVVVDFYTDWCGPCKMIYPELVKLSAELEPAAQIVKFNCNKYNKDMGIKLQIKVAPTFHIYKNSIKVADMTGAKVEKLRQLILQQQTQA